MKSGWSTMATERHQYRYSHAYALFGFILVSSLVGLQRYKEVTKALYEQLPNEFELPTFVTEQLGAPVSAAAESAGGESTDVRQNTSVSSEASAPSSEQHSSASNEAQLEALRAKSSVDYFSCCGLGHRLSKNADAYYVAKFLNLSLRMYWGFCDSKEVAHYLFGPQPAEQLVGVTSTNLTVRLHNEVFGLRKLIREGNATECKCTMAKYWSDVEYYTSLLQRFRFKHRIDRFRSTWFDNHTVFGLHIRAGNNETGDFGKKNRGIHNLDQWFQDVVRHVQSLVKADAPKPPLLYVATDTPSLVHRFRIALEGKMEVIDLPQNRPKEGTGVLFGARGDVQTNGQECLNGWEDTVTEMILLSYADVVIAGRPSSFVQTIPMHLALARSPKDRVYERPFCEIEYNGTDIRCFPSFEDWCCQSDGAFFYGNINQRYDYMRIPYEVETRTWNYQHRPQECAPSGKHKAECLPYDWPQQKWFEDMQQELRSQNLRQTSQVLKRF